MALYVQVTTLRQWPYKNLSRADQHVVARFFDSEPFFARGWDMLVSCFHPLTLSVFYLYLHSYHHECNSKDFFLIPYTQASEFFVQITTETGIAAFREVPPKKVTFRIDRENDDEPIFLGTVESKEEFDELKESNAWNDESYGGRGPQSKHNKKLKQQEKRRTNMASWRIQVESARRHLGFDSTGEAGRDNIQKPAVFVSVDVESYEFNHSVITEIGLSILDTARLPAPNTQYTVSEPQHPNFVPPRNNIPATPHSRAEAILALVESHHFRIKENRFLRNGTYVSDAADRFEFGSSEFISIKEAPTVVANCFHHFDEQGERKKIILVGHDTKADIVYLRAVGYDVTNIVDLEILDTAVMWRAMKGETQSRSLNQILAELELDFWNLHNAGMLLLCLIFSPLSLPSLFYALLSYSPGIQIRQ